MILELKGIIKNISRENDSSGIKDVNFPWKRANMLRLWAFRIGKATTYEYQ